MPVKNAAIARTIAAAMAITVLLAAVPQTALAQDEGVGGEGTAQCTDRATKAEIPIAILFTFPIMVILTPFWLTQVAGAKMRGGEDES